VRGGEDLIVTSTGKVRFVEQRLQCARVTDKNRFWRFCQFVVGRASPMSTTSDAAEAGTMPSQ
jgi:hypothetical protein